MSVTGQVRHLRPPWSAPDRRPLDVVHVIATLTPGGAERQLEMLTARSQHRTRVMVLYGSGGLAASMRAAGEPVEELQAAGWRKVLLPLALARRLRHLRPDVVHVHLFSAQVMAIPAARLARVPMVVSSEHSLMEDTLEGRAHTWWLRLLYQVLERLVTRTVAVSAVTALRLRRWGVHEDRISVVDLGIDFEAVAFDRVARDRVRRELATTSDTLVIGVVGRLEGQKRIDVALRACAPLLRDGALLVVAGAGPLLEDLMALAAELGISDQVRWLGSRPLMGEVYAAADVLLSASADESFGMAVVEAVGSGLAVVHAACPALEGLPDPLEQVTFVPASGDDTADAVHLGAELAATLAAHGQRRWPAPAALLTAYGAQAAADRLDGVYDALRRG